MGARRANFKQADATRALKAAAAAGLKPTGYRVEPGGAIIVMFGEQQARSVNGFDEIYGT
ncbi:hypothetical protein [Sphingobium yanoikuyae]|uniref:hypothetical protein n=1 Tax=Sphingobium yanoikuyae TaxID=13690 RepID=UPI00242FC321|nr:hypothetical protein [Sphingobium yanoikuyae]